MISKLSLEAVTVFLLHILYSTACEKICPTFCVCLKNFKTISCHNQGLNKIPVIPRGVEKLYLNKNQIEELPDYIFNDFNELIYLEMAENGLKHIHPKAFKGLYKLKILNLRFNHIVELDDQIFKDLTQLQTLILSSNKLSEIPKAIKNLKNLEELNLEFNNITKITFPLEMGNLKYLVISRNPIKTLEYIDFAAVRNTISVINLSTCNIQDIQPGSFKNFSNLRSLKISYNNKISNVVLKNVLDDLRDSQTLLSLNLDGLNIPEILLMTFQNFSNSIKTLFLSHNNIHSIETNSFINLNQLELLDLSFNYLSDSYMQNYMQIHNLRDLRLSHNRLTEFPNYLPSSLRMLDLSFNFIDKLSSNILNTLINVEKLKLNNNKILEIDSSCLVQLKNLKSLDLSFNNISLNSSYVFSSLVKLENLKLRNNKQISEGKVLFSSLSNLKSLDLSENNCKNISLDIFKELQNLKELSLSKTQLKNTIEQDVEGQFFRPLKQLSFLDISKNELSIIPPKTFESLLNLKNLTLKGNSISEISNELFKNLNQLEFLDLSENLFLSFNSAMLIKDKLKWINLINNSFSCTCDLYSLEKLITSKNLTLLNVHLYKCLSPPSWKNKNIMQFLDTPNNCSNNSKTWIVITGAVTSSIFVSSSALIIFYLRKKKMAKRKDNLPKPKEIDCLIKLE